jgi:hypothetical protein
MQGKGQDLETCLLAIKGDSNDYIVLAVSKETAMAAMLI